MVWVDHQLNFLQRIIPVNRFSKTKKKTKVLQKFSSITKLIQ